MIGAKFDLNKNQQTTAPHNEVNLAQRMVKISGQQAIALSAQDPARLSFGPMALFADTPSAGMVSASGPFFFLALFILVFLAFIQYQGAVIDLAARQAGGACHLAYGIAQ